MTFDSRTQPVLEIRGLEKRYGTRPVLQGVDLALAPGSHVGLVGNNGQGKTTLIRLVLGLLRPDAGEIRLAGEPVSFPRGRAQKRLLGYLPETVSFYPGLTGRRTLQMIATLKGASREEVQPLLELVGLADAAHERVKTYSKGMRQRLGLAQALLGNPRVLLLDEPTNGLDPDGIRELYAVFARLQHRDVAILTASHLLAEMEARLDGLILLKDGRLSHTASIPELVAQAGLPTRIKFALKSQARVAPNLLAEWGARPSPNGRPDSWELCCRPNEKLGALAALLRHEGELDMLTVLEPGLEEVFHHLQGVQGIADGLGRPVKGEH